MMQRRAALLLLGSVLALTACVQSRQSVVLLPGEEGHPVGAVAVLNEDGSDRGVIATANTGTALSRRGFRARPVDPAQIDADYGTLISDLPLPPIHFTLTFDLAASEVPPDQEAILEQILKAAVARPGAEVQIVGHTDTTDTDEVNDRVSRRRAEETRDYLIKRGLPVEQLRATWRGKRELLVPTADGVDEPRNRRVEVIIR